MLVNGFYSLYISCHCRIDRTIIITSICQCAYYLDRWLWLCASTNDHWLFGLAHFGWSHGLKALYYVLLGKEGSTKPRCSKERIIWNHVYKMYLLSQTVIVFIYELFRLIDNIRRSAHTRFLAVLWNYWLPPRLSGNNGRCL